jgi:integrase/recombinase XerD
MLDPIHKQPFYVARHAAAPFAGERERYLTHCALRGDSVVTLRRKAEELYWIARKLEVRGTLHVTRRTLQRVAGRSTWKERQPRTGRKLKTAAVIKRFLSHAEAWLRFLGTLSEPPSDVPFQSKLDEFSQWAREERGFTDATIVQYVKTIRPFLQWYGALGRPLSRVRATDIDSYLSKGGADRWCRVTVSNTAKTLRTFFRYGADQGWAPPTLANAIYSPRIYAMEKLPSGPTRSDVQRLFKGLDSSRPKDVRDRAILLLFALYGLRAKEVADLRLDHLDWQGDLIHVPRVKRRAPQPYPMLPSVGNAIAGYLYKVRRRDSPHAQLFLTIRSPYRPLSRIGLYYVVAYRLQALGVKSAHMGPHSLRHACATHLLSEGLSLKEIGDHLGHRLTWTTQIYAKVDLRGLREVGDFDLGSLQ